MASRVAFRIASVSRPNAASILLPASRRTFTATSRQMAEAVTAPAGTATPVKKPMGAFRGGLFGFLLGSTLAFGASFTYLRNEWKIRDDILMEDFASLRAACQRVEARFKVLEDQIAKGKK